MPSPRHRYRSVRRIKHRPPPRHFVQATFVGGPEDSFITRIARVPKFIRVIHNGTHIAAMDRLNQDPEQTDIVYAYRRLTGKHRPGVMRATYIYHDPQPRMARLAHPYGWQAWVKEQLGS